MNSILHPNFRSLQTSVLSYFSFVESHIPLFPHPFPIVFSLSLCLPQPISLRRCIYGSSDQLFFRLPMLFVLTKLVTSKSDDTLILTMISSYSGINSFRNI